jgi:SAF domain
MTDVSVRPSTAGSFLPPPARRTRRPSWLDLRLLGGIALVLLAVLGGATALAAQDHRRAVWEVSRDLAAGTTLQAADLRTERVQLGSASVSYLAASEAVVGRAVQRDLHSGELLDRGALTVPAAGVLVTVPVRSENAPTVSRGARITLWVSTKTCQAAVVVSGVPVQDVKASSGTGFTAAAGVTIVLQLPAVKAERVITALGLDGAVLRVGVLAAGQQPAAESGDLAVCAGAAR